MLDAAAAAVGKDVAPVVGCGGAAADAVVLVVSVLSVCWQLVGAAAAASTASCRHQVTRKPYSRHVSVQTHMTCHHHHVPTFMWQVAGCQVSMYTATAADVHPPANY